LDAKSAECILLGYVKTEGHKTYRLIDKLQQKVIFHLNVVFNELALIPIGKGGGGGGMRIGLLMTH